ncbi:MAG TPA: hypothetical protein HA362_06245 [Nanoarchaeota archaeon]|nr:hypothetical protein [Nanoarchaeota archaeon]
MVHKRFVRRGNKVYGPYLYNSKRVGNKVVNEYLGIDKSGRWKKIGIITAIFAILLLGIVYAEYGIMSGSSSGAASNLTVWDQGSGGIDNSTWLSNCTGSFDPPTTLCLPGKAGSQYAVRFYANYSNNTVGPIIGNCSIRINFTGTYSTFSEMNYNPSTLLYEFNSSFNNRSTSSTQFMIQVNCSNSTYDTLNATDYFEIKNSEPYKTYPVGEGPGIQTCNEDTSCAYNVSVNFTDDDDNDLPLSSFNINSTSATFSTCNLSVSSNGIITVLCINSSQAGSYNAFVTATDGAGASSASLTIPYIITAVNDYPRFTGSLSKTCTQGTLCSFYINASDEENGTITGGAGTGIGNLTFANNGSLFVIDPANGSISFTPSNDNVGTHAIQINVTDPSSPSATNSSTFTLTINDLNDAPSLVYACDSVNSTALAEDVPFSCWLNATDIDAGETHTFSSNYSSWFSIDCTGAAVTNGNSTCNVSFMPNDTMVYSHWINITVTDSDGLISSRLLNFSVNNTPDYPGWTNISNKTIWANVSFWAQFSGFDNDSLTSFGETIAYFDNSSLFDINKSTGIILFTPLEPGAYWINFTVNDTTARESSIVANFTVYENSYPYVNIRQAYNMTEGYSFYLNISANVTEPEGDTVTYADNTTLFNINSTTGEINFTPTDNNVGTHWVAINVTDSHGTANTSIFNFTVYNEEDAPVLGIIYNITDAQEAVAYTFSLNLTDADLNITGSTENISVRSNLTAGNPLNLDLNLTVTASNATSGFVGFNVIFTPSANSNGTYWVNISINDSAGLGDSQVFFINVSEHNAPPFFLNASASFCATKTAAEDAAFSSCIIIACDNDTNATLRFNTNYSWFSFNTSILRTDFDPSWGWCANTTASFTPLQAQVGNWSMLLNVTDDINASVNYTLYFNVTNVNDAPVLGTIAELSPVIGTNSTYDANATDEDNDTPAFSSNSTLSWFAINATTGVITLTPNSPLDTATHWINVTVNDTSGVQDSQVINVTARGNTAPYCYSFVNTVESITFDPQTETANFSMRETENTGPFGITCADGESDAFTYRWYWNGTLNATGISTQSDGTFGKNVWNYTASYLDAGYYNMTIKVNDSGSSHTYAIDVNVTDVNAPPMMYDVIPNISTMPSGTGWYNNVQNSRNLSAYFYDLDSQNISYAWYWYAVNESVNSTNLAQYEAAWNFTGTWSLFNDSANNPAFRQNDTAGLKSASYRLLTFANITEAKARIKLLGTGSAGVCFSMSGNCSHTGHRAFFNATDNTTSLDYISAGAVSAGYNTTAFAVSLNTSYWLKASLSGNRTLVYTSTNGSDWSLAYNSTLAAGNASFTGSIAFFSINAEAVFDDITIKDPNLRNMTLANEGGSNISFTPATSWYGVLSIRVSASDGINNTDSNYFNLYVDQVTVLPPVTVTQTTSSSSTTTQTKVADMTILVPSLISLTPLSKTIVPIILKNTGQLSLNTITLVASSNQSELRLNLNETAWPIIKIGDSILVNLDVDIGLLAPDRYTIRLDANSESPALARFAEIVVDVREKDAVLKAQLKEMIQFTRDLFLQNPECLELSELISEAEKKLSTYDYQTGLDLIHRANQGCKDFIAAKKGETEVKEKILSMNFLQENWKIILLETIGLIISILLLVYYFQRRSATRL